MKSRLVGAIVLVAVLVMVLGVVSQASAGGSNDAVIEDAQNGTIDGNWSAAQIRAALAYAANNPILTQYSDIQGVLEDYLASLQAPGAAGAKGAGLLAFTGSETILILAAGAGLAGSGLLLRRRSRP